MGKSYVDDVLCNVVEMDASHLIMGRPWPYDVDANLRCRDNVYVLFKNGKKIVLGPIREGSVPKASKVEGKLLLLLVNNEDAFDNEARESKQLFAIMVYETFLSFSSHGILDSNLQKWVSTMFTCALNIFLEGIYLCYGCVIYVMDGYLFIFLIQDMYFLEVKKTF